MKNKLFGFLVITLFFMVVVAPASAATVSYSFVPECVYQDGTDACTLCDIINAGTNFARIILGMISAVALLMFVLGGFFLITSGGNEERVTKGKKIMMAAIMGVLIVAFAWVGVNTMIALLSGKSITSIGDQTYVFGDSDYSTLWWQLDECNVQGEVSSCAASANGNKDVKVGTPCTECNDSGNAPGTTNCYCQVNGSGWQTKEQDGTCNGTECTCMSLCDKIARDYSKYSEFSCIESGRIDIDALNKCMSADMCPHQEGQIATHKCCGLEEDDYNTFQGPE